MIFSLRHAHGAAAVVVSLLFSVSGNAQNELWVLNETPPSLGRVELTSFTYEEVIFFEDVGYATDLEIQDDVAVVVLENREQYVGMLFIGMNWILYVIMLSANLTQIRIYQQKFLMIKHHKIIVQ